MLATFSPDYRQELLDLYADCKPLNLFGQGNLSPEAIAFAWRDVGQDFRYSQHVLAGTVQGTLFEGWGAGPIGVAAGVDYRSEKGDVSHGGLDGADYAFSFGLDYAGKIKVLEGFAETTVPVFRDFALGDLLELNGAIRYTRNKSTDTLLDQSRSINATSWKAGAIYDLVRGVRLRGTQSRDIRAAGFRELFQKTAPTEEGTAQGRVNNPNIEGPNKVDATPIFTGGNFGLAPEKADTTTIGVVLAPTFIPRFQVSLDWYQIKMKDAIANLNGQRVTDLCVTYDILCERVTFASPTNITRVDAGQANVGRIDIRGFDFEASYRLPLADVGSSMDGAFDFRFLLNHQYDFIVQQNPFVPELNYAGQSGPVVDGGDFYPTPKWMWNALIGYTTKRFNATVAIRHIGKGVLNKERIGPEDAGYDPTLPNTININRVDSATYVNLAVSYQLPVGGDDQHVEVFGVVENLFDKKPPIAPGGGVSAGATAYPTNPVYFDTFGMRWKAGVRVKL
jgi:outer membrane receptor protein involved in Fe transport